jgi:hypothetical protein
VSYVVMPVMLLTFPGSVGKRKVDAPAPPPSNRACSRSGQWRATRCRRKPVGGVAATEPGSRARIATGHQLDPGTQGLVSGLRSDAVLRRI